ncbi:MAG TPA: rod-binding protein [Alphaproteobacteria bacterium]|nr:rod-binding protein [Alphaproteobacteria bacterium]
MSGTSIGAPSADVAMMQMRQSASSAAAPTGKAGNGSVDIAKIKKSATEFEAVFATEMLSHMFEGVGADPVTGGGNGEEIYKSMMIEQYGQAIARSGTLGIADKVAAALIKAQEK